MKPYRHYILPSLQGRGGAIVVSAAITRKVTLSSLTKSVMYDRARSVLKKAPSAPDWLQEMCSINNPLLNVVSFLLLTWSHIHTPPPRGQHNLTRLTAA